MIDLMQKVGGFHKKQSFFPDPCINAGLPPLPDFPWKPLKIEREDDYAGQFLGWVYVLFYVPGIKVTSTFLSTPQDAWRQVSKFRINMNCT